MFTWQSPSVDEGKIAKQSLLKGAPLTFPSLTHFLKNSVVQKFSVFAEVSVRQTFVDEDAPQFQH